MATQQFPSIPLESLVAHLRQEGFVLDTRAVLNLQVVLRNFALQIKDPAKDLPRWIGPIVCRNADEQRKLVQACAAFFLDQERLMAAERRAAEEKERQEEAERQKRGAQRAMLRKYLLWGAAIVLPLAMLGFFLAVQWQPLKLGKASLERSNAQEITVEDTVRFQASMAETDTSAGRTWLLNGEKLPGNGLGQTLHFDSIGNYNLQLIREKSLLWRGIKDTSSTQIKVECKGKPRWGMAEPLVEGTLVKFATSALDSGASNEGLSFRWDFGDGNSSSEPSPVHDYGQWGDFTVNLSIVDSSYPDCPNALTHIVHLKSQQDTTKATLPPFPSAATPNIYKVTLQLWWVFLPGILLGLLTYVLVLIWQRRRQRSEAKRDAEIELELSPDLDSPYTIPWPNQDHRIAWDTVLDKLASAMTNRSQGERFQLHVPASISATIAAGGLPSLRMQANTQSTQWLALVDEESQSAIELRLIKWLLRQLHTETVQLDVYCYRGIPTELYQEGKPQRHSLARLASLYPQHRLLIFSRGDGLLQAYRSELLPALRDAFRQWKYRSLLTPEPASTWGRKEAAISELFGVCPLQSEALLSYFQLPETPSGNDHPAWVHKLIRQWGIAPEMPRRIKSLQSLREATGTARRFEWAKATLASETPHWELLLSAGDLLDNNQARLRWDELFALSRLPFLRDGDVSPALQAEAMAANNDPVLQTGRRAYRDLLVGAEEILKSNGHRGLAGAMVARELVVQNHRLDPNDEPTRLKLQKLVETGQHEEPGFVPKKPRRSIRPWEMGSVVASIATLLMVVVWLNYGSTRQDAPDQGLIFRVDSVPVQSPYFSWMDSMAQVYKSGEAAYLRGDYAPAIKDFTRGVVMAGMDSLSPQVREELLGLGGIERGQVAFRAYFVNALGLCSHYAGDTANACLLLRAVLLSYPDFYEANRVQAPNLKTLTQCGGADWAGNVLDFAGQPIYGAKLKWNAFGPGYPSSVYTTGRNGDFVLSGPLLKPGDSLFFSAPNYQDTFALAPANPSQMMQVVMRRSTVISQEQSFTLRGIATGQPQYLVLQKVTVFLPGQSPQEGSPSFQLNLPGAKAGDRINCRIEADGYESLDTILVLRSNATYRFPLQRKIVLEGDIFAKSRKPIGDCRFSINGKAVLTLSDGGVIEAYEVRQQLSVLGAPLIRNGATNLLKVEAEGFKVLQRSLNLPNLDFDLELEDSMLGPEPPPSKDLMIQLLTPKGKPLSTDFEVLLGGKTIFRGTAQNQGRFPIPEPLKPQIQKEGLLIKARGFADSPGHGTKLLSGQSSLTLVYHPEVQKILDDMVYIEGGTFTMGCTPEQEGDCREDEKPAHKVTLSGFDICKFELTQGQWRTVMGRDPEKLRFKGCDQCPVESVSWEDCQGFISTLNQITSDKFSLPTEAQWEFAARGGNKTKGYLFAGSSLLEDVAWYDGNSGDKTHAVGGKRPNEHGIYDMSGNVWEWCSDWWDGKDYSPNAVTNPKGPDDGQHRVLRGGSWVNLSEVCRVSLRFNYIPEYRDDDVGFRVTRD